MLATGRELLDKIRLGEDTFLELKEVRLVGGSMRHQPHRRQAAISMRPSGGVSLQ